MGRGGARVSPHENKQNRTNNKQTRSRAWQRAALNPTSTSTFTPHVHLSTALNKARLQAHGSALEHSLTCRPLHPVHPHQQQPLAGLLTSPILAHFEPPAHLYNPSALPRSNVIMSMAWGLLLAWARDGLGVPSDARNLMAATYQWFMAGGCESCVNHVWTHVSWA